MHTKLILLSCFLLLMGISQKTISQSISRSVICTAGETFVKKISGGKHMDDKNRFEHADHQNGQNEEDNDRGTLFSISYTIGEVVAESFFKNQQESIITIGFEQTDSPDGEEQSFVESKEQKMVVFPNPVSANFLNVDMRRIPEGDYNLQLTNVLGLVLRSEKVMHHFGKFSYLQVDVSQLKQGVYFIRIANPTFIGDAKFIKL